MKAEFNSDSDDDLPLSSIIKTKKNDRKIVKSDDSSKNSIKSKSSTGTKGTAALPMKKSEPSKKVKKEEKITKRKASAKSGSESDDDVPLSQIRDAAKKKKIEAPTKIATKTTASKKNAIKEPAKEINEDEDDENSSILFEGGKIITRSSVLYGTEKGELVKKLLCRWWFAMEWPAKKDLDQASPQGYDSLDGYPGMYICVTGESIGKLLDTRCKKTCPSFHNFSQKSCSELKDLLRSALQAQRIELRNHWGKAGTSNDKKGTGNLILPAAAQEEDLLISQELKWLEKINCASEDKKAENALKSAGFEF